VRLQFQLNTAVNALVIVSTRLPQFVSLGLENSDEQRLHRIPGLVAIGPTNVALKPSGTPRTRCLSLEGASGLIFEFASKRFLPAPCPCWISHQ
jgi:hypothetical protein